MRSFLNELIQQVEVLSMTEILTQILVAAALGFVIYLSYYMSHTGTIYSRRFNTSLVVLAVLTTVVMTAIGNNVALSLGMVGALSIVRFRTAIKDSRDTVYIAFEKTGCYISQVPEQYEPRWSGKLSIEYRKKFGYVPDKKTREAVRELAGFLMGRDLKLIGRTEYSKSGFAIRAMAQNPQSVNIVKVCRLCNQEIVPVHIYGNESLNFKETMEQLLPRYLHSDMRDVIQKTLPLYWSSFVLYVDNAIPVIASAIETLQKAWFALEENESVSVYYPKTKFRELKKDLIAIIDEKLEEGPYKNAVRNKVDQLNQMSVRDKNESFFAQLGITYGEREIQAIRMRNVFAHGDTNGKTDAGNMIEAIKVLQLLYAKSVLKLLGYEGEYIDWCAGGTRKTVY